MNNTIQLIPITPDNFHTVIQTKVDESQQKFVAPNTYSIAQAYVEKSRTPMAIQADGEIVGFIMYEMNDEEFPQHGGLHRFMIGSQYQGKGYGGKALALWIDMMRQAGQKGVVTSYVPGNDVAAKLYYNAGFRETGQIMDGEIIAQYTFESE